MHLKNVEVSDLFYAYMLTSQLHPKRLKLQAEDNGLAIQVKADGVTVTVGVAGKTITSGWVYLPMHKFMQKVVTQLLNYNYLYCNPSCTIMDGEISPTHVYESLKERHCSGDKLVTDFCWVRNSDISMPLMVSRLFSINELYRCNYGDVYYAVTEALYTTIATPNLVVSFANSEL